MNLNASSTPTDVMSAFAIGGTMTDPRPYVAVTSPPIRPRLSGKNLTELLMVQIYTKPLPIPIPTP